MKRFVILAFTLLLCVASWSQRVRHYTTLSTGVVEAIVDSIDFRPDLTRVYARLKGTPHTASRIDNIVMTSGSNELKMTDLDGVDPERWFQWEDSPYLPVEIDFPPVKKDNGKLQFIISGPRGKSTWTTVPSKK